MVEVEKESMLQNSLDLILAIGFELNNTAKSHLIPIQKSHFHMVVHSRISNSHVQH